MAAVAAGYSVHYNQTNNENALLGYENERVERAKLAKYGFIRYDFWIPYFLIPFHTWIVYSLE